MASPHQPDDTEPGDPSRALDDAEDIDKPDAPKPEDPQDPEGPDETDDAEPPTLYLRIAVWDVVCTCALLTMLVVLATMTSWPSRLFGFATDACPDGSCGLVPFGVDQYIFPVMWGGIGAAVAAAALGPIVSLLRGWRMYFWPILAAAILMLSSLAGYALTTFSQQYWH
jgi:hypothetical protein